MAMSNQAGTGQTVASIKNLIKSTIPDESKQVKKDPRPNLLFINRDFSQVSACNRCDEVYPGIILGDYHLVRDIHSLRTMKVTHVLNAAQGEKFAQIDTRANDYSHVNIEFLGIQAMDVAKYRLSQHFQQAADFIHSALQSGGKVFVHCHQGISRSATFVLVYLMMYKDFTLEDAIVTLRKKRPIFPNDGFIRQMIALESTLNAERNTAVTGENTAVTAENTVVTAENTVVTAENTAVTEENTAVTGENAAVTGENTAVTGENTAVTVENTAVTGENTAVTGENTAVAGNNTALTGDNTAVTGENTAVTEG